METEKVIEKYVKQLMMIIFGILVFQTGFGQVTGKNPADEQIMAIAKETVEAYEAGNWDVLRKNVAADAMFYNLGSYDSLTLDQTINYWKKGRETATPLLKDEGVWLANTVKSGPREGKWILHWGSNTLTYPSGETVSFPYHVALKFKDEKVQQAHFYYDNNRIIRALGYEIQPPLKDPEEDLEVDQDERNN